MSDDLALDAVLDAVLRMHPPRAGSLIVTVFGDSVAGLDSTVGLASLIELLAPFGLNARQIRTAVFRLAQDDWLACEKIGRKSYYAFTHFGRRQYERSARRIYAARPACWDGLWTLVLPSFVDGARREELKRALNWIGFGAIANGVLAHPSAAEDTLAATLDDLDVRDRVVVLRARTEDIASRNTLTRLIAETWRLDEYESRYREFIRNFRPALEHLESGQGASPAQSFRLQTLLIHEYRRILLKLTDLPDALLPSGWSGRPAMDLTARIYEFTRGPSAAHLEAGLEGAAGALSAAGMLERVRFS